MLAKRMRGKTNAKDKQAYSLERSCGHRETLWLDSLPTDYLQAMVRTIPCGRCMPRHTQELEEKTHG